MTRRTVTITVQSASAIGLMLVLATQQKLFAWPHMPEPQPRSAHPREDDSPKKRREPLTHAQVLPLAALPRIATESPAASDVAAALDVAHVATVGDAAGNAADRESGSGACAAAQFSGRLESAPLAWDSPAFCIPALGISRLLGRNVSPTGPPHSA